MLPKVNRPVGVSENQHIRSRRDSPKGSEIAIQPVSLRKIIPLISEIGKESEMSVDQIDHDLTDLDRLLQGEFPVSKHPIPIAPHRCNRGYFSQLFQHNRGANIAGMQDALHAGGF